MEQELLSLETCKWQAIDSNLRANLHLASALELNGLESPRQLKQEQELHGVVFCDVSHRRKPRY
jgi:hypothetical protein